MGLTLKLGVLLRGSAYFGGSNKLDGKIFDASRIVSSEIAWLIPPNDTPNTLGQASYPQVLAQNTLSPAAGAIPGVAFYFQEQNQSAGNTRYFVSAKSSDWTNALTNSSANAYTSISPLSPYSFKDV